MTKEVHPFTRFVTCVFMLLITLVLLGTFATILYASIYERQWEYEATRIYGEMQFNIQQTAIFGEVQK